MQLHPDWTIPGPIGKRSSRNASRISTRVAASERSRSARFPWSQTYRTREYLGLLNTYSDHLRLPAATRQRLFDAIAAAIDSQGGLVERNYVTVLYVAHKLS